MAITLWIALILVVAISVAIFVARWRRIGEKRLITCPENGTSQAVELDPRRHFRNAFTGSKEEQLRSCTRWPDRADCDQPCLGQIAAAPEDCRIRKILDGFYAMRSCVMCGREFGSQIDWWEHEPGLLDEDQRILGWKDFPPEKLPAVLERSKPICWDCKVVAQVVREHPERITHRPAH